MSTCLPIFINYLVSCSEKCVFSVLVVVVRHKCHLKYQNLIATKAVRISVQHPLCDIFHLETLSKHSPTFYPNNLLFPGGANWSLSLRDWGLNIVFTLTDFCCYLWLCYSFFPLSSHVCFKCENWSFKRLEAAFIQVINNIPARYGEDQMNGCWKKMQENTNAYSIWKDGKFPTEQISRVSGLTFDPLR